MASLLIVIFNASVTQLIPLYAIGVFMSFTLSQFGHDPALVEGGTSRSGRRGEGEGLDAAATTRGWQWKLLSNGLGGLATFVVTLVFAVTKFSEGAWIIVIIVPTAGLASSSPSTATTGSWPASLSLDDYGAPPRVFAATA